MNHVINHKYHVTFQQSASIYFESHDVATSSFSDGYNIGEMLLAMSLESGTAYDPPEFETRIADVKYKIIQFINLNKLERRRRNFSIYLLSRRQRLWWMSTTIA